MTPSHPPAALSTRVRALEDYVRHKSDCAKGKRQRVCPQCFSPLKGVTQSQNSPLNEYQFDAVKAGDYYCALCKGDESNTGFKYWWTRDLKVFPCSCGLDALLHAEAEAEDIIRDLVTDLQRVEEDRRQLKAIVEAMDAPAPYILKLQEHIQRVEEERDALVQEWRRRCSEHPADPLVLVCQRCFESDRTAAAHERAEHAESALLQQRSALQGVIEKIRADAESMTEGHILWKWAKQLSLLLGDPRVSQLTEKTEDHARIGQLESQTTDPASALTNEDKR